MMSKHLFFKFRILKIMREDLRHKLWMIVLSVLGNFLLLPVAWLIMRSNMYGDSAMFRLTQANQAGELLATNFDFFTGYIPVLGGIFCIFCAFVTGLFSFRFLFHKNMVDSWQSMPVKRRTLYKACYFNGILIWFVPFFICLAAVFLMAAPFVRRQGGNAMLLALLGRAAVTAAVLAVVFLLVYHLVLTAVMLSGNILNTLVCAGILGFGAVIFYMLIMLFFMEYMETFYTAQVNIDTVVYASPLVSAFELILSWADGPEFSRGLWKDLALNLGIGLALGACAYYLYLRRESELAEQGLGRKGAAAVFRTVCGVEAGMGGWILFAMIAVYSDRGWGIFGALLGSVLVFGGLDVIFRMEFKAFFAHKLQMALTVGVALAACFAISGDWFGYDAWLPDREEIAQISVWDRNYANHFFAMEITREEFLERVGFQDMEMVYPYLERMAEHESGVWPEGTAYDRVLTRITLKNGRSYYRDYRVAQEDRELIWPMLTEERYREYAWLIDETVAENCLGFEVETGGGAQIFADNAKAAQEVLSPIVKAYNRDVREDLESVMLGEGRLLARLSVTFFYSDREGDIGHDNIYLDVYQGMEHTVEALEQAGLGGWTDAGERGVESIELGLPYRYKLLTAQEALALGIAYHESEMTKREAVILARAGYGVGGDGNAQMSDTSPDAPGTDTVSVTDPDEIEELFSLLSFTQPFHSTGVFRKDYVGVQVNREGGISETWYIQKGDLPEKYILRFGE